MKKIISILAILLTVSTSYAAGNLNIVLKSDQYSVSAGTVVKVKVLLNKPVSKMNANQFFVDGGSIESVRKLSSISYLVYIRPQDEAKTVGLQVESEAVKSIDGTVNEDASNEVTVKIVESKKVAAPVVNNSGLETDKKLTELLDAVVKSSQQNTQKSTTPTQNQPVQNNYVQTYNCNGVMTPVGQNCVYYQNPNNFYMQGNSQNYYGYPVNGYYQYSAPQYNNNAVIIYDEAYYDDYYDDYGYYPESYYTSVYYKKPKSKIYNWFDF